MTFVAAQLRVMWSSGYVGEFYPGSKVTKGIRNTNSTHLVMEFEIADAIYSLKISPAMVPRAR